MEVAGPIRVHVAERVPVSNAVRLHRVPQVSHSYSEPRPTDLRAKGACVKNGSAHEVVPSLVEVEVAVPA